jgi:hypothetical protein
MNQMPYIQPFGTHYEVRIIVKGKRHFHGVYQSKQLALIVAAAQAKITPIPGVVEVWECDDIKDTLVKGFPGQR